MGKSCPNCGKTIHESACFCPYCARSINARESVAPPRAVPVRAVRAGLALLLCAALVLGLWAYTRPRTISGFGEVVYTDGDGSYRLRLSLPGQADAPLIEAVRSVEPGRDYSETLTLCAADVGSGSAANETFARKILKYSVSFDSMDPALSIHCYEQPVNQSKDNAVCAFSTNYRLDRMTDCGTVLTLTLEMTNGDTVSISQRRSFHAVGTVDITPADTPMSTSAELQDLLDSLNDTVGPDTVVNIHLPAVTYAAPVTLSSRQVNLTGSTGGGERTVFAGGVSVSAHGKSCFENICFAGSGSGTGVSASGHLEMQGCTLIGWETGLEGIGGAWVNCMSCSFEDNGVAFRFNSDGSEVMNRAYSDNTFLGNGVAVLLESVPTDATLYFNGCVFSGNGTDISNPCAQEIYITEAMFD